MRKGKWLTTWRHVPAWLTKYLHFVYHDIVLDNKLLYVCGFMIFICQWFCLNYWAKVIAKSLLWVAKKNNVSNYGTKISYDCKCTHFRPTFTHGTNQNIPWFQAIWQRSNNQFIWFLSKHDGLSLGVTDTDQQPLTRSCKISYSLCIHGWYVHTVSRQDYW